MKLLSRSGSADSAPKRRRLGKKWLIPLVIVLAALILLPLVRPASGTKPGTDSSRYTYARVERKDITASLTDSGALEPADSYTVISLVSGEILQSDFETGDVVSEDDVLYRIDSSDLSTGLERAENALSQRQRAHNKLLDSREDLTVRAPISGTVSQLSVKAGDKVNAGMAAAVIEDTATLLLTEYYNQSYAGQIYPGMGATVSVTDRMLTLPGIVKEVSHLTRVSPTGAPCFAVTVQVTNPGSLNPGDTATCWLNSDLYPSITDEDGFEANARTTVYYDIAGTVGHTPVRSGERVTAGQLLVQLSSDTLEDSIRDSADALRDSELSLQSQRDALDNYTISAPIRGTIVDKYYKQGENAETGRTLCTIFDLSSLTVTLNIDELDITKVSVGQQAVVTADAVAGKQYEGVITEVGINGAASAGVTTYPVKVEITQTEGLLPGMNVDVSIVVEEHPDVLAVPADAVQSGGRVLVKTADGSTGEGAIPGYEYVRVEVGASNEDFVEILSGLNEGDEIAVPMTTSFNIFDMMQMGPGAMGGGQMSSPPMGGGMPGGMGR